MSERLTTAEVAQLLGCSKRTVIRNAKRHGWHTVSATDEQGRPVTTYDKAQVLQDRPAAIAGSAAAPGTVTEAACHREGTATERVTLTEPAALSPMTATRDTEAVDTLAAALAALADSHTLQARQTHRLTVAVALAALLIVGAAVGIFAGWRDVHLQARESALSQARAEVALEQSRQAHQAEVAKIAAEAEPTDVLAAWLDSGE